MVVVVASIPLFPVVSLDAELKRGFGRHENYFYADWVLLFYSEISSPSTRGRVCRDSVDKKNLCILVAPRGTEQSFPYRYSTHALHMQEHESRVKTFQT